MTLQSQNEFSVPEETVRVARAAYPKGNICMKMRDTLGTIYQDESFAHLFPHNGRPTEAPWRLALITILQFMEDLPDRQAADAARGRIDWKYLLGLPLDDPGFDFTLLSDFRKRLIQADKLTQIREEDNEPQDERLVKWFECRTIPSIRSAIREVHRTYG